MGYGVDVRGFCGKTKEEVIDATNELDQVLIFNKIVAQKSHV